MVIGARLLYVYFIMPYIHHFVNFTSSPDCLTSLVDWYNKIVVTLLPPLEKLVWDELVSRRR